LVFSPDETLLAWGTGMGEVLLLDTTKGECRATLRGNPRLVYHLAFTRNGSFLAAGGLDADKACDFKLWDVAKQKEIVAIKQDSGVIDFLCFSPDDQTLATGWEDHTIKLWKTARLIGKEK
jgi:WD40 repeat protein